MQFFDTHCHIHESDYPIKIDEVERLSRQAGVDFWLCVGVDVKTSQQAVEFVRNRTNAWASVGLHPHEANLGEAALGGIESILASGPKNPRHTGAKVDLSAEQVRSTNNKSKIVAIGECGLDYFYNHSPKADQVKALRFQIELAQKHNVPIIFHVREAFDDFWPIFDSYKNLRGVLHSFSDNSANLEKALQRNLYVGVNGIMTFTKDQAQIDLYAKIPLKNLLLETDSPFLTPKPFRGNVNLPANITVIAKFLAELRGEDLNKIAQNTTKNALKLFNIK